MRSSAGREKKVRGSFEGVAVVVVVVVVGSRMAIVESVVAIVETESFRLVTWVVDRRSFRSISVSLFVVEGFVLLLVVEGTWWLWRKESKSGRFRRGWVCFFLEGGRGTPQLLWISPLILEVISSSNFTPE